MTPTADERLARQRDRLEKSVADLADTYDPRNRQARDQAAKRHRSHTTHVIGASTDDDACVVPLWHPARTKPRRRRNMDLAEWDGLYVQLSRALGQPAHMSDSSGSTKSDSRPPGWRSDVSALMSTIERTVREWKPGGKTTLEQIRNLPHVTRDPDITARAATLAGFVARATLALGYRAPSLDLPGVACRKRYFGRGGWRWTGCEEFSLKTREGGAIVWCSTPWCHDSVSNPDCTFDDEGGWSCRDSDGDRTHAVTFTKNEWLDLWEEKQARDRKLQGAAK